MRRPWIILALCPPLLMAAMSSSSAMATPAHAANPQIQTIRTLQHLETVSYQAGTAFYLYSVLNRDPQQYKKMQGRISAGDELVQKMGNSTITQKWNAFKRTLSSAKFTSEGVADNASITVIDGALTTLTQTLRSIATEQRRVGQIATDKMADMLYEQYVLMQIMTAAYLRQSADYFGGAIVAHEGPVVEIDKLADKFSTQLEQLNHHYAKNPQISLALKEVTTKWTFIKKSFKNFNQNNVPFVVGRYNEQITEKLLTTYEQLL